MAEGLLRPLGGERYEVCSAGLLPRDIDEPTSRVMAERGIDISGQRPKPRLPRPHRLRPPDCAQRPRRASVSRQRQRAPALGLSRPTLADSSEAERLGVYGDVHTTIEARLRRWLADSEAWSSRQRRRLERADRSSGGERASLSPCALPLGA